MRSFSRVLLVQYVTFILVFLKTFVTAMVSLPKYVTLDQCVFSVTFLCFLELDTYFRTSQLPLKPFLLRLAWFIQSW